MASNVHLLLHNIVGIFSVILIFVMGLFVLVKDYRKTVNITLGLTFLAAIVAIVSDVIGVSVSDPILSHSILMWNISIIFICVFNFHCVMAILNREQTRKNLIILIYILGILFAGTFLLYPSTFLGLPVSKMYFPNYYVPGQLHLAFSIIFKLIIPIYFIYELAKAHHNSVDRVEKNRFLYFTLAFAMGWGFGLMPTFLTWNINIDPLFGLLFPVVFAVPFSYAVFNYKLLNIKVVIKRALIYIGSVLGVSILVGFFDLTNQWLSNSYAEFPLWLMPLVSGILIVTIGIVIFQQFKEGELLKYEFINTIAHKFRTPLTHIKWVSENMKSLDTKEEILEQLGYIESSNAKLVELIDLLANASRSEDTLYKYRLEKGDLSAFAESIAKNSIDHATAKKIHLIKDIPPGIQAIFDLPRLRFVLQTLVENAINYTPEGGTIMISVMKAGDEAICSVKDTGIGISKNELTHISTKSYRGERAKTTDTEGMGIGLFVSKNVLERHRGRLIVDSEGENKGSIFSFAIPAAE